MIRVRNEEKTLYNSIASLLSLTIPLEIIVILHCCTDASETIARSFKDPRIKIHTYNVNISRAGYENLATDSESPHSMVRYDNWCFSKTCMPWVFKWDADFVATQPLIHYLESRKWEHAPGRICINAKNSSSMNGEYYLACGQKGFTKHLFWEVALYNTAQTIANSIELDKSIVINHMSELSDMKTYWLDTPWYITEESEEAKVVKGRIERLVADFGVEPEGLARASNPACDPFIRKIRNAKPAYVNIHW